MRHSTIAQRMARRRNFAKRRVSAMVGTCRSLKRDRDILTNTEYQAIKRTFDLLGGILKEWKRMEYLSAKEV